jgi:hypothetical protein
MEGAFRSLHVGILLFDDLLAHLPARLFARPVDVALVVDGIPVLRVRRITVTVDTGVGRVRMRTRARRVGVTADVIRLGPLGPQSHANERASDHRDDSGSQLAEERTPADLVRGMADRPTATGYIRRGSASYDVLPGYWTDAGTPASKLKASILVGLGKGVTFHD